MKASIYVLISVIFSVIVYNVFSFCIIKNQDYFYKHISNDVIGKDISDINDFIGVNYEENWEVKGMLIYPYEIGQGAGYSLTIYYNKENKVISVSNKIFYIIGNTILLSKELILTDTKSFERIIIWPFVRVNMNIIYK